MTHPDPSQTTLMLSQASRGDAGAEEKLTTTLYDRLRELAAGCFGNEDPHHTLQPTALVHEAYLRLIDQSKVNWEDRSFFLRIAGREMRRILIDHARQQKGPRRGGGWGRVSLKPIAGPTASDPSILDLEDALNELAALNDRQARIVELRFFAGLTIPEVATNLGVSTKTVEKDWRMARAFLLMRLGGETL